MKLSKITRVGIILSFIWVIGAGYLELSHQMTTAQSRLEFERNACVGQKPEVVLECMKLWTPPEVIFKKDWEKVAYASILAILITPLGWLIGLITIRLWRWVKAG